MTRYDIIQKFIDERQFKSFLEIGTFNGDTFKHITIDKKESVDPDPNCKATHIMTSDEYFKNSQDKWDIIFIDGLHEHSQVFRDICNSLEHLHSNGVIVLHDCMPKNEKMAMWDNKSHQHEEWTGDTWKAYYKVYKELPYMVYVIDTDYGCGVIDTSKSREIEINNIDMDNLKYTDYLYYKSTTQFGVKSIGEFTNGK
jgi:hypothetical protein